MDNAVSTIRLTAAQVVVRYLAAQRTMQHGVEAPLCAGCWAIFGHAGNLKARAAQAMG